MPCTKFRSSLWSRLCFPPLQPRLKRLRPGPRPIGAGAKRRVHSWYPTSRGRWNARWPLQNVVRCSFSIVKASIQNSARLRRAAGSPTAWAFAIAICLPTVACSTSGEPQASNRYRAAEARLTLPRLARNRMIFETWAGRRDYPQESFFGIGPDSSRQRQADYALAYEQLRWTCRRAAVSSAHRRWRGGVSGTACRSGAER